MVFLWSRSRGSFSSGKFIAPLSLGRPRRLFQSNRSARNRLISHGRAAGIADMKKFLILCGLILTATPDAFAQAGGYRFDNFDTSEGVKVVVPEAPAAGRKSRKRLRLTARAEARRPGDATAVIQPASAEAVAPAPFRAPRPAPVEMALGHSLAGFSTGDGRVDTLIVGAGQRHGVDPVLLYAIMHRESAFRKRAVSHAGARGLMQLMPATARRFGVGDIFDPAENIEGGTRYMRWLLDKFGGDVRLALAGYNAGEGAVMKYGWRVPPYRETQEYVRRITERYALMRDPTTPRRAARVTRPQLAKLQPAAQQPAAPVYEREVFAVRTPDGKLMLISQ
jgi:hypothetical protein